MLRALIALILVAGLAVVIIGAAVGGVILVVIGDVLVVGGVLTYFVWGRRSGPPSQSLG
jgi:uncharacterized membrane protein